LPKGCGSPIAPSRCDGHVEPFRCGSDLTISLAWYISAQSR
jgi:hypothetical protein